MESELTVERGMKPLEKGVTLEYVVKKVLSKKDTVAKAIDREHLIDAAGPGRKVFQVTVSKEHSMVLDALKLLCEKAGYIKGGKVVKKGTVEKLEFYWVVPVGIASNWKAKAPYAYRKTKYDTEAISAKKDLVNKCLKWHIEQYVLPMMIEGPQPYEQATKGGKKN